MTTVEDGCEVAILGGGCFWCLEPVMSALKGVREVQCGYAGGTSPDPDYESICTGRTGHAEVVRVVFDPQVLPFSTVLEVFFCLHDPTTLNRQGHDIGTQYRSVVFCQTQDQRASLLAMVARIDASGAYSSRVVTEVVAPEAGVKYYPAEKYHQAYFKSHGHEPYCSAVIAPKVAKCRQRFAALL